MPLELEPELELGPELELESELRAAVLEPVALLGDKAGLLLPETAGVDARAPAPEPAVGAVAWSVDAGLASELLAVVFCKGMAVADPEPVPVPVPFAFVVPSVALELVKAFP